MKRRGGRRSGVTARLALPLVLAVLGTSGCGEGDPEPPDPPDLAAQVERNAREVLSAGPSELTIEVITDRGSSRYEVRETVDPDSGWFLTKRPDPRPGVKFATRSLITGPAFSFGADNVGRAYDGPIPVRDQTCWVEGHGPAGSVRDRTLSAEEALVTAHTVLALMTRNVTKVREPTLDLGELAPFIPHVSEAYSFKISPPDSDDAVDLALPANADATRRYIKELQAAGGRIVKTIPGSMLLGLKEGSPRVLVISLEAGRSALDITPRRPASTVIVTFDSIGGGEPVREPRCLGIE